MRFATLGTLLTTVGVMVLSAACLHVDHGADNHRDVWGVCAAPSDCVLEGNSCCGSCGRPTALEFDGVNKNQVDLHRGDVCPEPLPCPLCPTQINPDLQATCQTGRCEAVDVHQLALSACVHDADCRLRVTACCECGGSTAPFDLIAINVSDQAAYQALTCDPQSACPACAPTYPTSVEAYCATDAHCAVRPVTP